VSSVVLAQPGAPARFSRSTIHAIDWIDPWEQGDELVRRLVRWGYQQPEPPVLFYQDDRALLLASRHRDQLRQAFRYVIPDQQLVEQLVDKQQFQKLAEKLKLPVPKAVSADPSRELPPSGVAFPVIVKPLTRRNDLWNPVGGGGKAVRYDTPEALRAAWPMLAGMGARVLVQELIPGPESQIESYHVYVDDKGDVVADFTGRKIRTYPVAYGDSTALEITDAWDVTELGRKVVKTLRLKGVAKLDFKRAPDGQLLLLEINPRFTLWNHLGAVAGVNIPALVYGDLTGRPRPTAAPVRAGVQWCKVWSDQAAARAGGMSLLRWLPWALGCEAKSAFAWDDPMPLIRAALWRLGGTLRPQRPAPNGARLIPSSAGAR
jgi:predicted ATP-grasp superfamily ATP-dependent carboligase